MTEVQGKILQDDSEYPVQPRHINATGDPFWGAFDHLETEISAKWVVALCQKLDGWKPFSYEQIQELYHRRFPNENFSFNRLVDPSSTSYIQRDRGPEGGGWIVSGEDGKFRVTDDFVQRCLKSSPAADIT